METIKHLAAFFVAKGDTTDHAVSRARRLLDPSSRSQGLFYWFRSTGTVAVKTCALCGESVSWCNRYPMPKRAKEFMHSHSEWEERNLKAMGALFDTTGQPFEALAETRKRIAREGKAWGTVGDMMQDALRAAK